MKYNLQNNHEYEQAKVRLEMYFKNGYLVELKRILPKRTNLQNAYLHLILGWFAIEYGETMEYVKVEFFKKLCNPEMFVIDRVNPKTGEIRKNLRSTADPTLDTKDFTIAIERFRNWSASVGIYLPAPNEDQFLKQIECEIEKYKEYI
jgi:hypothetical protein